MSVSGEVAIIGCGTTRFGENFDMGYNDMLIDACYDAFDDAKIEPSDIQAAWLGTYLPFAWGFEGGAGTSVAEPLNLYPIPVTRVANFCATGMEAVRAAAFAVAAGEYDMVLAVGVEKMREVPGKGSLVAQHVEKGHPLLCKGRTAPGMFALLATRYFEEFDADETILGKVAVKNHKHGSLNPKAHFRKEISLEQAIKAPPVAEPLKLFDCCPTTDGAAACIVTTPEIAKKSGKDYVVIKGIGLAVAGGYYSAQFDQTFTFTSFKATQEAAKKAYSAAGITDPINQIDVVELHDCFTITEIINYEDLGFAEKGKGWQLIDAGDTYIGEKLPVNTGGGLKSCGHPVGASGIRMINQICTQLRGKAEKMQVEDAQVGIAHTLGGPGSVSCVFILEKGD